MNRYQDIRHIFEVTENRRLSSKTRVMRLKGDVSEFTRPGQFVEISIPGFYLRRPISVCKVNQKENELTLLYDVVGNGTLEMSRMTKGDKLDLLTGLGNGFSDRKCKQPLLLGGGIGCAPLLGLADYLHEKGICPILILGFNTADDSTEIIKLFKESGHETLFSTVDGSAGVKGFVTDVISHNNIEGDYFYACGPMPMLRSLCLNLQMDGEVSLESRMGCGFGACMCCSLETVEGAKRICKDGPVFRKEELIWK